MDSASLLAFDDQAQTSYEATAPATITIADSEELACAGGRKNEGTINFGEFGKVRQFDCGFRVRKTLLDSVAPAVGMRVTFDGQDWRIARVINAKTSVAFVIFCEEVNKR